MTLSMHLTTKNILKTLLFVLMPAAVWSQSLLLQSPEHGPLQKLKVKEGFPSLRLQDPFRTAWENTFAIFYFGGGRANAGTMSLIYSKDNGDRTYLGFLTARHVLRFEKGLTTSIFKNIVVTTKERKSEITSWDSALNFQFVYPEVSQTWDLGFVVVSVPSAEAKGLTPLKFANSCNLQKGQPLLTIGFPSVSDRAPQHQRVPIENPEQTYKRWSSGYYVGDTATSKGAIGIGYGTTIDAILGNSGGPVLNAQAEIVGVLSAAITDSHTIYRGNENGKDLQALSSHSFIVDCQSTKDFAKDAWQNFLKAAFKEI